MKIVVFPYYRASSSLSKSSQNFKKFQKIEGHGTCRDRNITLRSLNGIIKQLVRCGGTSSIIGMKKSFKNIN